MIAGIEESSLKKQVGINLITILKENYWEERVLYEPSFSMLKNNIILKKVFNLIIIYGII